MAQMSLLRAHHVFNRITAETAFQTDEPDAYSPYGRRSRTRQSQANNFTLSLNISVDTPVTQQADAYRTLALTKKDRLFRLMDIGTKIRAALVNQQAKCGVTELVTARVMHEQKIKILEHLLAAVETSVYDSKLLQDQADAMKARLAISTQGTISANVATTVLSAKDRDDLRKELNRELSARMGVDDELGRLNSTNYINIDTEDLTVLQEAGLAA